MDDFDLNEDADFPFPERITRDAFLKDLHIDPENPTQSIINIKEVAFNVDQFLFEHYRYAQLDDLHKELNDLLKELDQELFDLVNNDYFDFINLGKALEGGEGLVDRLRIDVTKYRRRLNDENKRLEESQERVKESMDAITKLQMLKRHAQQMILLDNFITKFELLLNQNKNSIQIEVIKQLTSLYLTIHQLITTLPPYQFITNKHDHINVLRYEFQAVVDEHLRGIRLEGSEYKDVVDILGIYSIIGDESRAVKILKDGNPGGGDTSMTV